MATQTVAIFSDDEYIPFSHMPSAESGLRSVAPRLLAAVWLVLLGGPLESLFSSNPSSWKLWGGLAAIALFVCTYVWNLIYHPLISEPAYPRTSVSSQAPVIILTAVSATLTLSFGEPFLLLFVFAGVSIGTCLPRKHASRALFVVLVIATLSGALARSSWSTIAGTDLTIFGIGALIILLAHLMTTVRELRSARLEIARLAVSEERLRFSRDLHDLLGHSLSLITLKSELAGRLVESRPERAAAEIADIERIARSALQETREAVAGYRQPTLASELSAAREMLTAAGINVVATGDRIELQSDIDSILGWAVREGVTNVIRHSRATQCTIIVNLDDNDACVEVIDNGIGSIGRTKNDGNGLRGLTERVTARGGWLDAGARSQGGFHLSVTVPCAARPVLTRERDVARPA